MRIKKEKIARVSKDFFLTILASVVYTFARQIVVYPLLAHRLSDADYGTFLTIIGLVNVCTALFGNCLNNTRLVQETHYSEQGEKGDFNYIGKLLSLASVVFAVVLWVVFHYSWITGMLVAGYVLVSSWYQYGSSLLQLELDFKRWLIVNVLVSVSYILAAYAFASLLLWPMVFLLGELAGLLYVSVTTRFYREPWTKTPLFSETAKRYVLLALSSVVGVILMYADRMLLYPILGAAAVSYYATAAFFGKSMGVVMNPIQGVLLDYFSQKNIVAGKRLFVLVNALSLAALGIFFLGCWLFAPWATRLLYPTLYEASAPYILLANLGAVIATAGNMATPLILKFCSSRVILAVQTMYGVAYVLSALYLLPLYGLAGFCWATIFANTLRLLALYAVGFIKFK